MACNCLDQISGLSYIAVTSASFQSDDNIADCKLFALRASEAAAQCIVIAPVCEFVCVNVCVSVTTITRNCVHRSSPNWLCR